MDKVNVELWYFVATMISSPYMTYLYEMSVLVPQPPYTPHGTIALVVARKRWVDHYTVAHRLQKDLARPIEFYRLCESEERILAFIPGNQYVNNLCSERDMWPIPRIARTGRSSEVVRELDDEGAPDIADVIPDEHVCVDTVVAIEDASPVHDAGDGEDEEGCS